jgi:glucokinase
MKSYLLGFDIGGTKCAVILGRSVGDGIEIVERRAFPTKASEGPESAFVQLEETSRAVLAAHGLTTDEIRAIGISCGGPLDMENGAIVGAPNLPGWDDISLTGRFSETLGIPTRIENDANACALAEWRWGAGRGTKHMIFLTFGTGMGAGIIIDGKLYSGAANLAGEVGHMRLAEDGPLGHGKRGSFEGFCSGGGIAEAARDAVERCRESGMLTSLCATDADIDGISANDVFEAACAGDPTAADVVRTCGRYLGRGLSILIDVLNPEAIVIGSIFARRHEILWPIAKQVIEEESLALTAKSCRVLPAELGEAIGDYAALSVAAM